MSPPENEDTADRDRSGRDRRASDEPSEAETMSGWLAESTIRIALAVVGLVLLIFAVGQLVGLNLLEIVADVLVSPVGQWIIVAFFALLLIALAQRGFRNRA